MIPITLTQAIFYMFAALAVLAAGLVLMQKNPMHSVLYLAFCVLSTAGMFFALQAEFLGAIQILVYAGGVVVLYIFVIIIINMNEIVPERRKFFPKLFIFTVPVLLIAELATVLLRHEVIILPGNPEGLTMKTLAEELLSTYLIPFEVASILLLAVLVGSIIIARRKLLHDSN